MLCCTFHCCLNVCVRVCLEDQCIGTAQLLEITYVDRQIFPQPIGIIRLQCTVVSSFIPASSQSLPIFRAALPLCLSNKWPVSQECVPKHTYTQCHTYTVEPRIKYKGHNYWIYSQFTEQTWTKLLCTIDLTLKTLRKKECRDLYLVTIYLVHWYIIYISIIYHMCVALFVSLFCNPN